MTDSTISSNAKPHHPFSPHPITRQSIVKKIAKWAFLLLIFPVTLILVAFRLKPTILSWANGIPNNPAVDRVPNPALDGSGEEEDNRLPDFEQQNESRTLDENWRSINNFFKQEKLDPIDMPAPQLDVLKRHPDFLRAIVTLIEGGVCFHPESKNKIIKTAVDAYCIAGMLGNPEGVLEKLTEHLQYIKDNPSRYILYFRDCIKLILDHGLKQCTGNPCIDDFFTECSDTVLAENCIREHLISLNSDDKEVFLKTLSRVRLCKFFNDNIDIKILLTKMCKGYGLFSFKYIEISSEDSIGTVECIKLQSLFNAFGIGYEGTVFEPIQRLFSQKKEFPQREEEARARQSRQQASPTPVQRRELDWSRELDWNFFESFCRNNEVHLPLSHDQVAEIKSNANFLPVIIQLIEDENVTSQNKKTVVQTIIDLYNIGYALEQPWVQEMQQAKKPFKDEQFLAKLTKKIREFHQKNSLQESLQKCLKTLLEHGAMVQRHTFQSNDFPAVYDKNKKAVDLLEYQSEYISSLSEQEKERNDISIKLRRNIAYHMLFNIFIQDDHLKKQLVQVCKRLELTDGSKLNIEGKIETLFTKHFTKYYDRNFFLMHYKGFKEFLRKKLDEEQKN